MQTPLSNKIENLHDCVDDAIMRMLSKRLQLNSAKTGGVLWCSSSRRQHQIPHSAFWYRTDDVMPSAFVRNLGMYIDVDVSVRTHCQDVSSLPADRRHLRMIGLCVVIKSIMQLLVVALVLTRLDYGNATLAGLADRSLVKLQSVLNAVACLIFMSSKFDHVTPFYAICAFLRG